MNATACPALLLLLGVSLCGCGSGHDGGSGGQYDAELQHCVDVTNQLRATNGKPPLARSAALEAFAADGAESDAASGSAHGHFIATQGGGVASAENGVPGWDISFGGGTISGVVDSGLQMMWDEGPGGGHYDNMNSDQFTALGCGIHVTEANAVWVVMDFS